MALKDIERDIDRLEADLKKLETEYNLFFAGRSAKPPWDARAKVEAAVKKLDRTPIAHTATRFRFTTVQARFVALVELWERTQRSREEGRAMPVGVRRGDPVARSAAPPTACSATSTAIPSRAQAARRTPRAARVTSGPMPSPGSAAMRSATGG